MVRYSRVTFFPINFEVQNRIRTFMPRLPNDADTLRSLTKTADRFLSNSVELLG